MDRKALYISGRHHRDNDNTKACVFCGHLSTHGCCQDCLETARQQIETIGGYLKKNPRSNAIDICRDTGIPYHNIKALLELGWLTVNEEDRII